MAKPNLPLLLLLGAATAWAQEPDRHIRIIDFYGYSGLDLARLRAELPFHVGDLADVDQLRELHTLGGRPAAAHAVFGTGVGLMIYVGLQEPGAPVMVYNPAPTGTVRMPAKVVELYDRSMDRLGSGGLAAGDDTSQGYSMSKDPQMRHDQQGMLHYARSYPALVFRVLAESAGTDQRVAAAWVAGYAPQTSTQVKALTHAVLDPNPLVRNNATRCLGVLLLHNPAISKDVDPEPFLRMLHSIDWTDTNKSLMVLQTLTAARDPALMAKLRSQALEVLREMAQWRNWGHASMAATVLGRVLGIEEARLQKLLESRDVKPLLAAR